MAQRRREDGMAILTVMLAVMLLTILGSALFLVARVSLERAAATTDSTRALDAAESGLETAAAAIIQGGFTAGGSGTLSGSLAGKGQYDVSWAAKTALPWFTLISTGYYPDRTAPTGKRRVKSEAFSLNPWDFLYAGGMTGASVNGDVRVTGPFYVNDKLTLGGDSSVFGGPLIIADTSNTSGGGDLILTSSGVNIGKIAEHVTLFIDGLQSLPNNTSGYHADPIYFSAPKLEFPDLTEQQLDYYRFDNTSSPWRTSTERPTAVWDSNPANYSTPLVFNKDSKPNYTDAAMLAGSSRVSWTWTGSGNNDLTIIFDNSEENGKKIYPILFVDGDLTLNGGQGDGLTIRYQGVGTIVASGKIEIFGNVFPKNSPMPIPSDGSTFDGFPVTNCLGLITRRNISVESKSDEWLAAAVYSADPEPTGGVIFTRQSNLRGGLVTQRLNLGTNRPMLWAEPNLSFNLPPRMPSSGPRINSIIGWTELTPTP